MANLKSSQKQARRNGVRYKINLARKTALRTAVKKVLDAVESADYTGAQSALKQAEKHLSRAKGKGLMHTNTVARKMSRLSAKVVALRK